MPTLASVAPAVPPMMIISAGMLMKEAGLVPSIIELSSREPKAMPIPMAVAAFIAPFHRRPRKILQSWAALVHELPITASESRFVGLFQLGSSSTADRRGDSRDPLCGAAGRWERRRLKPSPSTLAR